MWSISLNCMFTRNEWRYIRKVRQLDFIYSDDDILLLYII